MSTSFDPSKHPRGGHPGNPGQFAAKQHSEADPSLLAQHAADSPLSDTSGGWPRHAAGPPLEQTAAVKAEQRQMLNLTLEAYQKQLDHRREQAKQRWPDEDVSLRFPVGPMVSNIDMETGDPDFIRSDQDGNSRPVMPRLPEKDAQQVERTADWLTEAARQGRHRGGYGPDQAVDDVASMCDDLGIEFEPGADQLADDLDQLADRVGHHDSDGTRDTLDRINTRQQQAQLVQPQVFDQTGTGWRPPAWEVHRLRYFGRTRANV